MNILYEGFMRKKDFRLVFLLLVFIWPDAFAQPCQPVNSSFQFSPTTRNRTIEWQKFPEFSLPFKIVWGGPRFGDTQKQPLKHGFSHIGYYEGQDPDLEPKNRAWIWYGVASPSANQPWETIRSPWNNNTDLYKSHFRNGINAVADNFHSTFRSGVPNVDLMIFDIERNIRSNDSILVLKNHPLTPQQYKSLDNQSFILQYKKDMQNLYAEPFKQMRSVGIPQTMKLGSYADPPIPTTYINYPSLSWREWTTATSQINYLNYDFSKNALGGEFHNQQDFWGPTAYYFFDYPSPLAVDYLSFLLFQVEINRAWSNKPIIPFVSVRFFYNPSLKDKFIRPYMAEATAIFPFFSGASGLWLWDDPLNHNRDENFGLYEHFINGLHRLSLHKNMFEGNYELVIPTPARDYNDTQKPIWRGVFKENNLLVAAHNPYAKSENDVVTVPIAYKNWQGSVTLKGYEVFLCKFDLNLTGNENPSVLSSIEVLPNPTQEELKLRINATQSLSANIELVDAQGRIVYAEKANIDLGSNDKVLKINQLSSGTYFVRILNSTKKFIKQ